MGPRFPARGPELYVPVELAFGKTGVFLRTIHDPQADISRPHIAVAPTRQHAARAQRKPIVVSQLLKPRPVDYFLAVGAPDRHFLPRIRTAGEGRHVEPNAVFAE